MSYRRKRYRRTSYRKYSNPPYDNSDSFPFKDFFVGLWRIIRTLFSNHKIATPPPLLPDRIPIARLATPLASAIDPIDKSRFENMPYRRKFRLLSKGEIASYLVLVDVIDDRYLVAPQISLCDLVFISKKDPKRNQWHNYIAKHRLDFVICHKTTFEPLLVIELDDRTHKMPRRIQRDAFVNEVLRKIGLPVHHVPAQPAYDVEQLRIDIAGKLRRPN